MADRNESIGVSLALKIGDFIKGLGEARTATETTAKGMGTAFETETTSRLDKLKSRLADLKNEKPKIEVDSTAFNAVTGRVDELKTKLKELQSQQFSLGNVADIKASETAIRGVETEINSLESTLKNLKSAEEIAGKGAEDFGKHIKDAEGKAKEGKGQFEELRHIVLGVFGGNALISGATQFGHAIEHVFEAGKEEIQSLQKLKVAFNGNEEAAEAAAKKADELAGKYNIMPGVLKEISTNAAVMGGELGQKLNPQLTELAAGFEKMNVPGANSEAVLRAFLKGGEEGAEGLGRLQMAAPDLAAKLAGITDPAEKVTKALEIMGPKFKLLAENAKSPAEASERVGIALAKFEEKVGKVFYNVVATYIMPPIGLFVDGLTSIADWFEQLGPPGKFIIELLGGLGMAFIALIAVQQASIALGEVHLIQKSKEVIADALTALSTAKATALRWLELAPTIAVTAATWLQIAATWALNGALAVLTSPITLIIGGLLLLAGGLKYAYDNSEGFRNVVNNLWAAIKTVGEWIASNFISIIQWLGKELSILWDYIKVGIEFYLKWLNPIGLLIQGFQYLYEKVSVFRGTVDAVVGSVKNVVGWFGDLFSSTEKAKTAAEEHAEAVQKEAKSFADAKAAYDKYAAALAKKRDDTDKDTKQEIDNSVEMINQALGSLGMKSAAEFNAAKKRGFPGLDKEAVQEAVRNIEYAQAKLKALHDSEKQFKAAGDLAGTNDDADKNKVKDTKDTYAQILSAKITHEKEMYDLDFQTSADTIKNLRALQAKTQAMKDEDFKLNDAQRKQAKNLGISQGEMMASLRLKSLDEINKAVEEQVKKEQELRKAADIKELAELNKKQEEIGVKRNAEIKATSEYLKKKYGLDFKETDEYNDAIAEIDKKTKSDLLDAQIAHDEKLRKAKEDARLKEIDDEKKLADSRAAEAESGAKNNPVKLAELALAKKLAFLNIELEREKVVSEGKIAVWRAEQQKKIDLMDDGDAKNAAQAKLDIDTAKKTADAQLQIRTEYANQERSAEAQFHADRLKAVEDHLKQENLLYQSAATAIHAIFSELTKALSSAFSDLFSKEKKGAEGMTENDKKLAALDLADKKAKLQQEVRDNKISYEEYTLKITALDEKVAKEKAKEAEKEKADHKSVGDVAVGVMKSVTDALIAELAKRAEKWVADQVMKLALSLTGYAADTAASSAAAAVTASAWAPAAAAASVASFGAADAAGIAGMTAAYSTSALLAKVPGAAEGEYITGAGGPKDDNHIRRTSAGETIVDAATTKKLGGPDFLGHAKKAASLDDFFQSAMPPKTFRVYSAMQQDRGIVPQISPMLSSSAIGGGLSGDHITKLVKAIDKMHSAATDLSENGVSATIGEDHFQNKLRQSGKSVEAAKRQRDKRVSRRAAVRGGGMK